VEVVDRGLEVDLDVGVVDELSLELGHVRGGVAAADRRAELEDVAAEPRAALDEVHLVAHLAEGERGRHAGDAAADDEGRVGERHVDLEQRLEQPGPGDRHAHEVLGFLGRLLRLVRVHPRRLVADVRHLEEEGVESRFAEGVLEDGLVCTRRTARDHDPVEALLLDGLADELQRVARARVHRVGGEGHAG